MGTSPCSRDWFLRLLFSSSLAGGDFWFLICFSDRSFVWSMFECHVRFFASKILTWAVAVTNYGYVSHIPAIRFWCHCTYRTLIWCKIIVENFVRIAWTVFEKKRKKSKNGCFLAIFGLILAMFLTSQPYDFDAFAHAGAPLGVEWLCKISWKSFGQCLRNLKFSWTGREKKKQKKDSTIA